MSVLGGEPARPTVTHRHRAWGDRLPRFPRLSPGVGLLWALQISTVAVLVVGAGPATATTSDDVRRRPVPADQARARAIVLTRADLGSAWRSLGRISTRRPTCPPAFAPRLSRLVVQGERGGEQLRRQGKETQELVASSVEVYGTAAQANQAWRLWSSPAAIACMSQLVSNAAPIPEGSLMVDSEASALQLPRVAPRQLARRFLVLWVGDGSIETLTVDYVHLVRGRTSVALFVQRLGPPGKPDEALERRLLRLLGKRLAVASPAAP